MKLKEWLYQLFYFNKQERNGVFVLGIIIVVLIGIKFSMSLWVSPKSAIVFATITPTDSVFNNKVSYSKGYPKDKKTENESLILAERFVFNPNTISTEDAQRLGFSGKLAAILINFRNKGGHFYKPEDLKKLYGVSTQLYNSLESYILIPQETKGYSHKVDTFSYKPFNQKYTIYKAKEMLELNSADSLSIVYLKGIGPGFTKRIIKYRTMLGGFHSANQLREVYGMTDSLFMILVPQIQLDKNKITKIPINAIDFNSLRKHPYFNYASAQAIINFKFKHGKLSEKDMRDLGIFSEEKLNVILPYLQYD